MTQILVHSQRHLIRLAQAARDLRRYIQASRCNPCSGGNLPVLPSRKFGLVGLEPTAGCFQRKGRLGIALNYSFPNEAFVRLRPEFSACAIVHRGLSATMEER